MNPSDAERVTYFAETNFRNQQTKFGIKNRDRTRHMYVVGKSGVGKSTLLENMAAQDIQNGEGLAVLDPHGSFAEKMLDYIPANRIKDVVYFAPFDTDNPISFNMLEDVGAGRRHFVASGLMSTFKKIWVDAWSARMEYILNNILLALLEYPDATLLGVNRMLADKDFRNKVVENISDPSVKAFWTDEFAKYGERYMQEAGAAIQNKIGQFVANPLVRNIIGQPKSSFDIRTLMDNKKILIVNFSKGRIGEQNTSLLGSMIITKIYLAAMSRADVSAARMAELPSFYFYVDEFQSFANESFADILSEARKYKLGLVIAHQYIAQMEEPVRDAVFGNVGTSVSFRVGPLDAELLEKVYSPQFVANDLVNLGFAQIYLSLMINDMGSQPFSAKTLPPIPRPSVSYRNDVIEWTRQTYALPKDVVEKNIRDWYGKDVPAENSAPTSATYGQKPQYRPKFESTGDRQSAPRERFTPKGQQTQQGDGQYQPRPYQKPQSQLRFEKPPMHNPFKNALKGMLDEFKETPAAEGPTVQQEAATVLEPAATPAPLPKPQPAPTPEVGALTALDVPFPPKKATPPAVDTAVPFTGEKTLRESIPPVKHAERGPTEQNKNLLREALRSIGHQPQTAAPAPEQPVAPKEAPVSQPVGTPPVAPQGPQEISHDALRKVLE